LYQEGFPLLARYVSRLGGSFEEAKDVFQDALVIYYEKISNSSLDIHTTDRSYLIGIAKHLYLKKYNSQKHIEPMGADIATLPDIKDPAPAMARLLHFLGAAGKKCMDLLQAFYYDKKPLTDIANNFGYAGVRSATVQKYKCIEKVRESIKQKALGYEDFLD
jgi:DNA-directed RNA polymerase specialized sigma24 family protein